MTESWIFEIGSLLVAEQTAGGSLPIRSYTPVAGNKTNAASFIRHHVIRRGVLTEDQQPVKLDFNLTYWQRRR